MMIFGVLTKGLIKCFAYPFFFFLVGEEEAEENRINF
jgi:hypothetical protein